MRLMTIGIFFFVTWIAHGEGLPRVHIEFEIDGIFESYFGEEFGDVRQRARDIIVGYLERNVGFARFDLAEDVGGYVLRFSLVEDLSAKGCIRHKLIPSADGGAVLECKSQHRSGIVFGEQGDCLYGGVSGFLDRLTRILENNDPAWIVRALSCIELAGPSCVVPEEERSDIRVSRTEVRAIVDRSPGELDLSLGHSELSLGFTMELEDAVVPWGRYELKDHEFFFGANDRFNEGIRSSISISGRRLAQFQKEAIRICDAALYVDEYYPSDSTNSKTHVLVSAGLQDEDYGAVLDASVAGLAYGDYGSARRGLRSVIEQSTDPELVSEALQEWIFMDLDVGADLASSLLGLPRSQIPTVLDGAVVDKFLDDPFDRTSPIWKDEALEDLRDRFVVSIGTSFNGKAISVKRLKPTIPYYLARARPSPTPSSSRPQG